MFKAGDVYKLRHKGVWATFVANEAIFNSVEPGALEQLRNVMELPGVEKVTAYPGMHFGYGCPIEITIESSTHLYPESVGTDPACAVGFSKLDLKEFPEDRQNLVKGLSKRIGVGNELRDTGVTEDEFLQVLDGSTHTLSNSMLYDVIDGNLDARHLQQFLTIGGGNHVLELSASEAGDFYITTHFGSRGLGNLLSRVYDGLIKQEIGKWGGRLENDLTYVPYASELGMSYYNYNVAMGNFSKENHTRVHKAVAEILGCNIERFDYVPHNFIEMCDYKFIGRKGTTPNYPEVDAPLVVLGNMVDGSVVFSPGENANKYGNSISHGSGRVMSRTRAKKELDQGKEDTAFFDVAVGNFESVPIDEAKSAYKSLDEVRDSLIRAGVGKFEFRLLPLVVLKG